MAVFHDQDWQSNSHEKKKQYQKQEQMTNVSKVNPYQKSKQVPKPYQKGKQWHQEELPFEDKQYPWRQTPLTDTEIEELFWGKLVQLGWRLQTYDEKNIQKKNIVLPCCECNKVLDSYSWVGITKAEAVKMSDSEQCNQMLNNHSGFPCKAIPEEGVSDV